MPRPYRVLCLSITTLASITTVLSPASAIGQPSLATAELECRHEAGDWQPCQMGIERMGNRWWPNFSDQRFNFQNDGKGRMTMRIGKDSGWKLVQPRWVADRTLCWNEVCARGEIPLD